MPSLNVHGSIPYYKPNFRVLKKQKKISDIQELQNQVFLRITQLAEGKYDVAYKIWKKSVKDNEVRLSRIPQPPPAEIPNLNESFVLSIILSMGSVGYDDLLDITGPDINLKQLIYKLKSPGLIEDSNQIYRINPEAVNFITGHLRKNRMVW